ncbi:MAG: hypothetical protein WC674_00220 [Candidatus Krumholzibacteriia bacterium]
MKRTALVLALLALGCFAASAAAENAGPAYTFKFSGYFKADFVYDQTRVNSGNYALYVSERSPLNASDNDIMSITARESRFGLDFMWNEKDIRTDARLEVDFYGLGVSPASLNSMENKAAPMLRHAYVKLTKGHWSLLAGQTSDIISPLVPKTANYTVLWDQGNIGYRRPQLRVSTWADLSDHGKVTLTGGIFRTLGGDLDGDKIDDGADSGAPTFQGRLAMSAKVREKGTMELGVSGHYGTEEYLPGRSSKSVESWSGNVDLRFAPCDRTELTCELFVGDNLGAYYGGVGQTVNPLWKEIGSRGGWAELSFRPVDGLWLNAGYGVDNPDDDDFVIPANEPNVRSFIGRNSNLFASVMYDLTSTVTAMVELSRLKTTYAYRWIAGGDELRSTDTAFDDTRIQFALKAAIR